MRLLALFFTFFICSLQLQAQGIQVGFRTGLNVANVTDLNAEARFGISAGVVGKLPLTDKIFIQPELNYDQQGAVEKGSFLGEDFQVRYKLNYINLPVMFKYYVEGGFFLQAGPQLGYLIKNDMNIEGESSGISFDLDDTKKFDFSLGLGAGYQYGNYFVDARYKFGLVNVYEIDNSEDNFQNRVFQLSFGVYM